MKNTANQYLPSTTVTRNKYCSTIVLGKDSINLETKFRDSIQLQIRELKISIVKPSVQKQKLKSEIQKPKLKSEIQIHKSKNSNIGLIVITQPSLKNGCQLHRIWMPTSVIGQQSQNSLSFKLDKCFPAGYILKNHSDSNAQTQSKTMPY